MFCILIIYANSVPLCDITMIMQFSFVEVQVCMVVMMILKILFHVIYLYQLVYIYMNFTHGISAGYIYSYLSLSTGINIRNKILDYLIPSNYNSVLKQ